MSTIDAYAAGILDGEGSISLAQHQDADFFQSMVTITNTDEKLLSWLVENFGGKVQKRTDYAFQWRLTSNSTQDDFLDRVRPYLVCKKRQAEIVREYRQLPKCRRGRGGKLPDDMKLARWKLYQEMCSLNFSRGGKLERAAATTERVQALEASVKRQSELHRIQCAEVAEMTTRP